MELGMKGLVASVCASILIFGVGSYCPAHAQNSQQKLMTSCNAQAGAQKLAGDARKSFMSDCLSGKTPAATTTATPTSPQERMKSCNVQATTQKLMGDARKQFMSTCLKG
jgi:psiF repeat